MKNLLLVSIFVFGSFSVEANDDSFSDVSETHESYKAIEYFKKNNFINGYDDGSFKPDDKINRAEFVTIIGNAIFKQEIDKWDKCYHGEQFITCLGDGPSETEIDNYIQCFPDIEKDIWYTKYVCFAKAKNIIQGYPDGRFRGDENINFAESSAIILNTLGHKTTENKEIWYKPFLEKLASFSAIPTTLWFLKMIK